MFEEKTLFNYQVCNLQVVRVDGDLSQFAALIFDTMDGCPKIKGKVVHFYLQRPDKVVDMNTGYPLYQAIFVDSEAVILNL
jgi:hypothetical protein